MSKVKFCNYCGSSKIGQLSDSALADQFAVENIDTCSPEELLKMKYDVIEFSYEHFKVLHENLRTITFQTHQIGVSDCLIKSLNTYRPVDLNAATLGQILVEYRNKMDTHQTAMIIGEFSFSLSMISKLAQSGFIDIALVLLDGNQEKIEDFQKRVGRYIFGLNLNFYSLDDLTTIEVSSNLFITNFKKEINPAAYELLTYFNFLNPGALLLDWNSDADSGLIEEAKKADIHSLTEPEIIKRKYKTLLDILKISPKV
jgi:hypothetical protein